MGNIVTFGLCNVKYSLITINNGNLTYGKVKALKGAQELSSDIIGGSNKVYGDDLTLVDFNAHIGNSWGFVCKNWSSNVEMIGRLLEL